MVLPEAVQARLEVLPDSPGVYLMFNARGEVIYVGKAISLLNRVRSYFHASSQENPKVRRLVAEIADLDWIVTASEVEALILEANLIKKHRPRFNVRLKDDKRYPYLKISAEPFPKVTITRRMERDGARYFGPYTSTQALRETLDYLRRLFPFRTCDREITGRDPKPCLYYDIKLCAGPCIGAIDAAGYQKLIAELASFLEGHTEEVLRDLREQIERAAAELQFERAAVLRDRLLALQQVTERQRIVSTAALDQDIIALARDETNACVEVFFVRHGRLLGREYFFLDGTADADESEMLTGFLQQFYSSASSIPAEILLPEQVAEAAVLESWLHSRRGEPVYLRVPHEAGPAQDLLALAATNAQETLRVIKEQWARDKHRNEEALAELQQVLELPQPPVRIECYDISTTQGVETVGSLVVFEHGVPRKSDYRRFKVQSVQGAPDDFASMREVLTRRFERWRRVQSGELKGTRGNQMWGLLPDLLVVDGGKGQLAVALEVLEAFQLRGVVPVIGLAKRLEEIYRPTSELPLRLEGSAPGLQLLQRIRDEAHRFAITYHRQRRTQRGLASQLDAIPGIGPVKRRALLRHFGSLEAIRAASLEELMQVPGISATLARTIQAYFATQAGEADQPAPAEPPSSS